MKKTYYEILGVSKDASEEEIRKAYRIKMRQYHPDLNPDKSKAEEGSRYLNLILEVLTDSSKRKKYDESLDEMNYQEPTSNRSEFQFDTKQSAKARRSAKNPERNPLYSTLMMLAFYLTSFVSALCIVLMLLWICFRQDPTGLMAQEQLTYADNNAGVEDELRKELKTQQKGFGEREKTYKKKISALEKSLSSMKTQKDPKELPELRKSESDPAIDVPSLRISNSQLRNQLKNWLVEYFYVKELVEMNDWDHHWWHPSAQRRLAANELGNVNVVMRPMFDWGGGFYTTDDLSRRKRLIGLFPDQMRPLAFYGQNWKEPNKADIETRVEELFESESRKPISR